MLLRDGALLKKSGLAPFPGAPVRPAAALPADGAYLIPVWATLGLLMAGWLAQRGARRLILLGRTGLPSAGRRPPTGGPPPHRSDPRAGTPRGVGVRPWPSTPVRPRRCGPCWPAVDDGAAPIPGRRPRRRRITEGPAAHRPSSPTGSRRGPCDPRSPTPQVLHEGVPARRLDFMYFICIGGIGVRHVPGRPPTRPATPISTRWPGPSPAGDRRQLDWVVWEGLGTAGHADRRRRTGAGRIAPGAAGGGLGRGSTPAGTTPPRW